MGLIFGFEDREEKRRREAERFRQIAKSIEESRRQENFAAAMQRLRDVERRMEKKFPTPTFQPTATPTPTPPLDPVQAELRRRAAIQTSPIPAAPTGQPSGLDILGSLPTSPEELARGLGQRLAGTGLPQRGLELADVPRQFVKREVIDPVVPEFDLGAVPTKTIAAPFQEVMAGVARLGGVEEEQIPDVAGTLGEVRITSELVEEAASFVVDPANAVFFAPTILKGARGAASVAQNIRRTGRVPEFVQTAMKTARSEAGARPLRGGQLGHADLPKAPNVVDAPQSAFHGTGARFEAFSEGALDTTALYGPGVYITDDVSIATSYATRRAKQVTGASAAVERVTPRPGLRLLNMEQPLPDRAVSVLDDLAKDPGDIGGVFEEAATLARTGVPGKQVNRAIQNGIQDLGDVTVSEAGEILEGLNLAYKGAGFDGLTHVGGIKGGKPHRVSVLFDPADATISAEGRIPLGRGADPRITTAAEGPAAPPLRGGERVFPEELTPARVASELESFEPPRVGRDIPDSTGSVAPEPPRQPPPPPDAPPPSIGDGLTGDPQTPGGLLARFQDRLPGRSLQQSDWAKYTGGLALEGKGVELEMTRLSGVARKIKDTGRNILSRTRNVDNEAMLKALHGEGPVPEGAQGLFDDLQEFRVLHEKRTIGDVPSFEKRLLPQYYPRGWRNANAKIDEFRLGQALERGELSPAIFKQEHAKIVATGKLGPGAKPGTLKTRSLPLTFSEAIDQGWEPLSWNAVDMIGLHAAELAEFRYSTVLGDLWKIERRAIPRSSAPTSWRAPDYPAFRSQPFVDADGVARMSEPLVVSPEDADLLKVMLGPRQIDATDALAYITSVFKRAKVALGLFQHLDLNYRLVIRGASRGELDFISAGPKAMTANFVPQLRPRLMRDLLKDPVIKEMVEEGLQLPGGLDVFKREMRVAIEPDLVVRAPIVGDLPVERLPGGVKKGAKKVQDLINGIYGYMGKGLFDGAQPQYMGAFAKSLRKELAKAHPEMTSRQVSALTAEQANIMMSNIPEWQSVLGPRLRQLARGTAFSVNEGEAWLRQMTRLFTAKGTRGTYLRQWAGYIFGTLAFAEVINYGITGELLPLEQMQPIIIENGRPTYNSKFARPRLDGDGPVGSILGIKGAPIKDEDGNTTGFRHVYLDLMGQADTPFRALNPQFFIMTRLSPQLSTGAQLLKGEKFFGEQPIEGPGETAQFAAQQLLEPIPLSGFTQERGRIGTVGAGIQSVGVNVSGERLGDVLARTRAQVMQEQGLQGQYEDLNSLQKPKVDNDPRVQAIFDEVQKSTARRAPTPESQFFEEQEVSRGQQKELQLADDAKVDSGQWTRGVWVERFRDRQSAFFNQREALKQAFKIEFEDEKPSNRVDAAIDAYWDVNVEDHLLKDGTTDWGAFFDAQDATLSPLTPSEKREFQDIRRKFDTPMVTEFRKVSETVDEFFGIPKYAELTVEQSEQIDALKSGIEVEANQTAKLTGVAEVDVQSLWRQKLPQIPLKLRQWVQRFIIKGQGDSFFQKILKEKIRSRFKGRRGELVRALLFPDPGSPQPQNPDRLIFRAEHPELIAWFPDIFRVSRELAATGAIPEEIIDLAAS